MPRPPTAVSRRLRLATGVTLDAVEQGDPHGLPVLLLHGITDSWHSFEPVLPHLPRWLHVVALTQRGHGDSDKPSSAYQPRDFAADAVAASDVLGFERMLVVGHSMGTTVAMRLALDHPLRCLGLLLAGAFARYQDNPGTVSFWRDAVEPLVDPIDPDLARGFQLGTLATPVDPALLDLVVGESLKAPARVWRDAFAGLMADEIANELTLIRAPTRLLHGRLDAFATERDQRALLAAIPGATLQTYSTAGHALHWEQPRRFAADLAGFAATLNAAGGAQRAAVASASTCGTNTM
jgi:pimeloyl-ACP methyl ester carboxylesterase